MKKFLIPVLILAVLIVGLSILCSDPILICSSDLPEDFLAAIRSQSAGVYSSKLPLVPVYVHVDSFSEPTAFYTVHYFPFGTVGMSYTENDGYNIEKPLTRS